MQNLPEQFGLFDVTHRSWCFIPSRFAAEVERLPDLARVRANGGRRSR